MAADRFHLITKCSGGGKSTMLAALAKAGFSTVPEPGRRIVRAAQAGHGAALPWVDPEAFARQALAMARDDLARAAALPGPVLFDRGVLDAAVAFAHLTGTPLSDALPDWPYARRVVLAPPWPALFASDAERRHDLSEAVAEYERLAGALSDLGLETIVLPRVSVAERCAFVQAHLSSPKG